ARAVARDQGEIFNVSAHTEAFLLKLLKDIEKELGISEKTGTNEDQLSLDVDAEK
ncbi:hypothetical protein HYN84_23875, partial [Vibrio parahaemolyticus]|nr:hypothetical protein [Vibrio parahaemolyticus]